MFYQNLFSSGVFNVSFFLVRFLTSKRSNCIQLWRFLFSFRAVVTQLKLDRGDEERTVKGEGKTKLPNERSKMPPLQKCHATQWNRRRRRRFWKIRLASTMAGHPPRPTATFRRSLISDRLANHRRPPVFTFPFDRHLFFHCFSFLPFCRTFFHISAKYSDVYC